jgi:hydrogenase maturation protease
MTPDGHGRVLVAGIGNIFFGDDGFGPAVIGRISPANLPAGVDVADYGIRGVHLAYQLLEGRHRCCILVDALPLGEAPGTLAVIEPGPVAQTPDPVDAHSLSPASIVSTLAALGGSMPRFLVVGCQPDRLDTGMALSPAVAAALDAAVRLVTETALEEVA